MPWRKLARLTVYAIMVVLVASCGFKRRGFGRPVSLCLSGNERLVNAIKRQIPFKCSASSDTLAIIAVNSNETAVSYSADNNVRQFVLTKELHYRIITKGKTNPIQSISTQKPLTINNNFILSSNREKNRLLNEMTHDLIQQLFYRLQHFRKDSTRLKILSKKHQRVRHESHSQ